MAFCWLCVCATVTNAQITLDTLVSFDGTQGGDCPVTLFKGAGADVYAYGPGGISRVTVGGSHALASLQGILNGKFPRGDITQGQDGSVYGAANRGGPFDAGLIYKITTDGALQVLHAFDITNGGYPIGGLARAADGDFYGVAGGGRYDLGTVFRISRDGVLATFPFTGQNGSAPVSLISGTDGNYYGTTCGYAPTHTGGTVFKMSTSGVITTLCEFSGSNGALPYGCLVEAADGGFYGTTSNGGTNCNQANRAGHGTVFRVATDGTLTTLCSFDGKNGSLPTGLIQARDGNFYGTTISGGESDNGTIFRVTRDGRLTSLVSFAVTNGCGPYAGLVKGPDGNLYGTTAFGGTGPGGNNANGGTLFRLNLAVPVIVQAAAQSNGEVLLRWNTAPGRAYRVECAQDLGQNDWTALSTWIVASNAEIRFLDSKKPGGRRFYRAVLRQTAQATP